MSALSIVMRVYNFYENLSFFLNEHCKAEDVFVYPFEIDAHTHSHTKEILASHMALWKKEKNEYYYYNKNVSNITSMCKFCHSGCCIIILFSEWAICGYKIKWKSKRLLQDLKYKLHFLSRLNDMKKKIIKQ